MNENNWGYQSGLNYNQLFNDRLMGSAELTSSSSGESSETWAKQFADNHFRHTPNSGSRRFNEETLLEFLNREPGELKSQTAARWLQEIGDVNAINLTPSGNNIVTSGGAKFTEGGVYSGVRGVSVSEVAGFSASSTYGTNVNVVEGNKLIYHRGDIARTEVYSKHENSSIRECEADIKSITKSTNGSVVNQTVAAIALLSHNAVGADMTSVNTVGGFYDTFNVCVGGSLATNLVGNAAVTINGVAGVNLALQLAIASVTYTQSASYIYQYNLARESTYTYVKAPLRLAFDQTDCTALVYENNFFNIATNNTGVWKVALKAGGVEASTIDQIIQNNRINLTNAQNALQEFRTLSSAAELERASASVSLREVNVSSVRENHCTRYGQILLNQINTIFFN